MGRAFNQRELGAGVEPNRRPCELLEKLEALRAFFCRNMTVPACQHDREAWEAAAQFIDKLGARHAGHDHISENVVELVI